MGEKGLIALDIDRTLLSDNRTVSEENRLAIGRAQSLGITVVLCTGRDLSSATVVAKDAGKGLAMIVQNGALTVSSKGEPIDIQTMEPDAVVAALGILKRHGVSPIVTGVHPDSGQMWCHPKEKPNDFFLSFRLKYGNQLTELDDLTEVIHNPVSQLEAFDLEEKIDPAAQEINDHSALVGIVNKSSSLAGFSLFGVYRSGVSKESALKDLAVHMGIDRKNILAVGDNYNDVGMVELAGTGVMVANAPLELQREADWIAPSNDDSGVAAAIDFFLRGSNDELS